MTTWDARTDTEMYAAGADHSESALRTGSATIRVRADADADVLLRIAVQLNFLNTAPSRLSLERHEDRVELVVSFDACAIATASLVTRKLAQLTSVVDASMEVAPATGPGCA